MKQLKTILFDFDGTLADSQWYWYTLGAKVLIDVVMYFLTFVFQRRILFKKEERAKCD